MTDTRCRWCGRWTLLDAFAGAGAAGLGYAAAGFCVSAVEKSKPRLGRYAVTAACPGARRVVDPDAVGYIVAHGHEFTVCHGSPTCTGYSRGTAALPDRFERYDRLIGATREALEGTGRPYVIENVEDARPELRDPVLICGKAFGLGALDSDGVFCHLKRHRLFESNVPLEGTGCAGHPRHEQIAGVYGGARRDKGEARNVRHGGYVPSDLGMLRRLLDPTGERTLRHLNQTDLFLAIPPVYTLRVGRQVMEVVES